MTVKREMGKENQHNMKLPQQGNYHRPVSGKRTYKHDNLDSFALETMCAHGPAELLHSAKETKENQGEKIKVYRSRLLFVDISTFSGLPRWLSSKEFTCQAGDTGDKGSIPGLGRSPAKRNSNPLQYSCLENPMDRGAWWDTVHGAAKESNMTWQQNNNNSFSKSIKTSSRNVITIKITKLYT